MTKVFTKSIEGADDFNADLFTIRQIALATAMAIYNKELDNHKVSTTDVIGNAKRFEQYLLKGSE